MLFLFFFFLKSNVSISSFFKMNICTVFKFNKKEKKKKKEEKKGRKIFN